MSLDRNLACPRCGIRMNHHADKPDPSDERAAIEIHTCPGCGEIAERRTEIGPADEAMR